VVKCLCTYCVSWQFGHASLIFIIPRVKINVALYAAVTVVAVCHMPYCERVLRLLAVHCTNFETVHSPVQNISFFYVHLGQVSNNLIVKDPTILKCITTLPCDLLLITAFFRLLLVF